MALVHRQPARWFLWFLAVLLAVGAALCGWVIGESLRPELGASMVLMLLPMIALPMIPVAILLGMITYVFRKSLAAWECILFGTIATGALAPAVALVVLG